MFAFAAAVALLAGACKDPAAQRPAPPLRPRQDPEPVLPRRVVSQLTVVSYNVLADPVHRGERIPALLRVLEQSQADIIALQEVAGWFLAELRAQRWTRGYAFTRFGGRVVAPGGQLIMARLPIRRSQRWLQPGRQRRVLVAAEVEVNGQVVAVATHHMESFLPDGPTRALQLDQVFSLLRPYPRAIVLGDFNFGDGEQPDTAHLDRAYTDVWTATRGRAPGFTWDMERSPMAQRGAFAGERSRRLDRLLVRGPGLVAQSARIVGDQPVAPSTPHVFPSDHFGLLAILRVDWR